MEQLTVVAKITAKAGKEKETKEALEALIPPTLKEEGCINYDLHVSAENEGTFLFYENWKSHELWQKHVNSDHIQDFRAKAEGLLGKEMDLSTWYLEK